MPSHNATPWRGALAFLNATPLAVSALVDILSLVIATNVDAACPAGIASRAVVVSHESLMLYEGST